MSQPWQQRTELILGPEGIARLEAARVLVVSNRGVLPVEGTNRDSFFGATLKRIPLTREGSQLRRTYCAFWKKDNSGYYVEEFADLLQSMY